MLANAETSNGGLNYERAKIVRYQHTGQSFLNDVAKSAIFSVFVLTCSGVLAQDASLGRIGTEAKAAVPALADALKDAAVRGAAALALGRIGTALSDARAIEALDLLREAWGALQAYPDHAVAEHAASVRRVIDFLELHFWSAAVNRIVGWINEHPYWTANITAIPIWILLCIGIFWIKPLVILKANETLRSLDFKLPDKFGGMPISVRRLLLINALSYRPRVLDAWLARHIGKARVNFERKRTVEERSVHVPVPVHFDKKTIPDLKAQDLRNVFAIGTGRLLIWGEGGSGKTSIACQIARWAMVDAPDQRPAPHRMLPVLIERELDFEVGEKRDPFTETVRGDLEKLIEARVDGDLLMVLLERRRVLVIVDHLSEMTDTTRDRVRPDVPDFPARALIVTSRLEERLGDVPKNSLEPLRVTGDYLFEFMGAYLRAKGVRDLFPDREFGQAGARLAELVGERRITVLLVKLYLDRLLEVKKRGGDVDREIPESILSLMLQYLNDINRAVPEQVRRDEREVHRDAKALAWACLKDRFQPVATQIDKAAVPALAEINPTDITDIRKRLDYLERRLRLIETVEPERDRVRFTLDPVAEYLAGLHIVEQYRADADAWRTFLDLADAMPGGLDAIRGFLLAVRDCCLARKGDIQVPEFIPGELASRAGLDLKQLEQIRLRERIARYAAQLKASDPADRCIAADALGAIGPAAETAVPVLIQALEDKVPAVRGTAAEALGQIGPAAVPALADALKDADTAVRGAAAGALGTLSVKSRKGQSG